MTWYSPFSARKRLLPPALRKGDTIGVMAPSSRVDEDRLSAGVKLWEDAGFQVYIHPQTYLKDGSAAGTPEQKAAAFHELITDSAIKAVIAARGGNQAGWMLPLLDYGLIRRHPKIIMGYSDVTALLNAITHKTGLVTFHGPVVTPAAEPIPLACFKQASRLLQGKKADFDMTGARILRAGAVSAPLVGGNLSLLVSLLGTPYAPDFRGRILFLEDCYDELSRFDRMFGHLRNAGILRQIHGLVVGQFTNVTDSGRQPFGLTLTDIVERAVADTDIPVLMDAPFGHGELLYTLPIGSQATLSLHKAAKLNLDGAPVRL